MHIEKFRDMYIAELDELYNAEQQLCAELPRLAASARHAELKGAFNALLADGRREAERVAMVIRAHDANPNEHMDQSMQALLHETEKWKDALGTPSLEDAGLIDSAQRLIHYEIAAYGTAAAYAGMLGFQDDKSCLHEILEEKKASDRKLSELAQSVINQHAAIA
jgi:ferritin-like metal-binding protein YciE